MQEKQDRDGSKVVPDQPQNYKNMATQEAAMATGPDYLDFVKNHTEACIQKYMSQKETMDCLFREANILPRVTSILWRRLEEENPEFFRAYSVRVLVLQQIKQFNALLHQQVKLMNQNYQNVEMPLHENSYDPTLYQNFQSYSNDQLMYSMDFSSTPCSDISAPQYGFPLHSSGLPVDFHDDMRKIGASNNRMPTIESDIAYRYSDGSIMPPQDYPGSFVPLFNGNGDMPHAQMPLMPDSSFTNPNSNMLLPSDDQILYPDMSIINGYMANLTDDLHFSMNMEEDAPPSQGPIQGGPL